MEQAAGFFQVDEIPFSRTHELVSRMTGAVKRMAGRFERVVDGEPLRPAPVQPLVVRRVPKVATMRIVTTPVETFVRPIHAGAPAPRRTAAARWYRGPAD